MNIIQKAKYYKYRLFGGEIMFKGLRVEVRNALIGRSIIKPLIMDTYEDNEINVIDRTIKETDRMLELGGCIGVVAMFAATKLQSRSVTSVEANPLLIPLIQRNARLNDLNINVINGFVGAGAGEKDFYVTRSMLGSSSTKRKYSRHVKVSVVDFQKLLNDYDPTYLIVDVEGEEINLLGNVKRGSVERICVETHPQITGDSAISDMVKSLENNGFCHDKEISSGDTMYFH